MTSSSHPVSFPRNHGPMPHLLPQNDKDAAKPLFTPAIPLLVISLMAILAYEPELRLAVPLVVGVSALMTVVLAFTLYLGERRRFPWSPALILTVAFALRIMFLSAPAQLSDDIYRYLWDGKNLLHGVNPYTAPPAAMTPSAELKTIHAAINHPEYATIYPPAAQLIFAAGAAMGGTVTGLKAVLVLLDLAMCAVLILLLQSMRLPVWRAALYAWNPLPVLEIAGSGHVDGAGMMLVCAGVLLMLRRGERRTGAAGSGFLFAAAGLVKLFPLVLAPLVFLLAPPGRRGHFLGGFCLGLLLLSIPFLPQILNMLHTLDVYARNWEFAGFAFNTLRSLTGSGSLARLAPGAIFLVWSAATWGKLAQRPAVLEGAAPALTTMSACYGVTMALLFTTPTLQPWYALMLAALLPFAAGPAGIVLCWSVLLTYRVQIPYFILGEWTENLWVTAAVSLAPAAAWVLAKLLSGKNAADPDAVVSLHREG